ncbi:hypothetical protein ES695_05000 [Candidatus Atribacteria bacterium 1244-E10-H5-B2]|nr:MAG: hypothetical protein ES695_05000 [Candidatus Atribacteria bacterium 1244-E10-H5-B2]
MTIRINLNQLEELTKMVKGKSGKRVKREKKQKQKIKYSKKDLASKIKIRRMKKKGKIQFSK